MKNYKILFHFLILHEITEFVGITLLGLWWYIVDVDRTFRGSSALLLLLPGVGGRLLHFTEHIFQHKWKDQPQQ